MLRSLILIYFILKTGYMLFMLFYFLHELENHFLGSLCRCDSSGSYRYGSGPVSTTTDFVVSIMTHSLLVFFSLWVCFVMNFLFPLNQNYRGKLKDPRHQYWLASF
uniref:Uncharacterized protein n=1 Tax=Picea glauca TaxID=3330 RepID=A0A101M4A3_PICGL|nr:hypothetical protein ABT39_MTgene451 [Picea glauca]